MVKRILSGLILLMSAVAASAGTLDETVDRTIDVRPGAVFSLANTNGRINVRSWDQPRVRIVARKHVESRDSDAARSAMKALAVEISPAAGGVRVNTNYPRYNNGVFDWIAGTTVSMSVEYDVTVPRMMDLQIENTNGRIEASDVRGSHRVTTTNGRIELTRCAGDVNAETTNGAIEAELTGVNPGRGMRLETTNGHITVRLPRSFAARIDAENTNGSIDTDLPVMMSGTHSKHALKGTINGGNAELRLRTTNGSIHVEAQ